MKPSGGTPNTLQKKTESRSGGDVRNGSAAPPAGALFLPPPSAAACPERPRGERPAVQALVGFDTVW
jgi:hypothetical protein